MLALTKFPELLSDVRASHDEVSMLLLEHIIKQGSDTLTGTVVDLAKRLKESGAIDDKDMVVKVKDLAEKFSKLEDQKYLLKLGDKSEYHKAIDPKTVIAAISGEPVAESTDKTYFCINLSKMNQVLRDKMIVEAAVRLEIIILKKFWEKLLILQENR